MVVCCNRHISKIPFKIIVPTYLFYTNAYWKKNNSQRIVPSHMFCNTNTEHKGRTQDFFKGGGGENIFINSGH